MNYASTAYDNTDGTATGTGEADHCPTCGRMLVTVYCSWAEALDLIEPIDEILKAPRKNWFIPKREKMVRLQPPKAMPINDRRKGSGWKRRHGHFVLRIC